MKTSTRSKKDTKPALCGECMKFITPVSKEGYLVHKQTECGTPGVRVATYPIDAEGEVTWVVRQIANGE